MASARISSVLPASPPSPPIGQSVSRLPLRTALKGLAMIRSGPALCLLLTLSTGAASPAAGPVEFDRDVRPILAEHCFACHGADSTARKAKLRLDERDSAVKKGAIVPGKPDESSLVQRVFSDDPKERMPPAKVN